MFAVLRTTSSTKEPTAAPVENALRTHLEQMGFGPYIRCDERQRFLTDRYLEPHRAKLSELFHRLRQLADKAITEQFTPPDYERPVLPGIQNPAKFPAGYCREIRNQVGRSLVTLLAFRRPAESLDALRLFRSKGGILQPRYGFVDTGSDRYTQNVIQLGSWIVDCAADAGDDATTQPVQIHPVDSNRYRNFDDYTQYYAVAKEYWGARFIETSRYLPSLAPYYPLMMILRNNRIFFETDHGLFARNILSGLSLSREFLRSVPFSTVPLPHACVNALRRFGNRRDHLRFEENNANPVAVCERMSAEWRSYLAPDVSPEKAADLIRRLKLFTDDVQRLTAYCPPTR